MEIERARTLFMLSKALEILLPSDAEFRTLDDNEMLQKALNILRHCCPSLDLSNGLVENMFRGLIHEARV
jgi:hypothetical protein